MASRPQSCANVECTYATDAKCVEGYSLNECPHLTSVLLEEIAEPDEVPVVQAVVRVITLASGEALDRANASTLQRRRLSRSIGLVGPNDAGKTSLVASVYGLLQDGPVAEILFAGSSTLVGLEKVCHDALVTSRRALPYTERTIVGAEPTFLHLDLRLTNGEVISLFLGDRSGEDYLAAADDIVRANDFYELRRADTLTLLVNGEHLAGVEHRHEVKAISPQIVDALIEGGAIREGCRLAIVLTKNDMVLASGKAERVNREFAEIVDVISERYSSYLSDIRAFAVAASPEDVAKVKRGDGVDELLRYWASSSCPAPTPSGASNVELSRMIDLFVAEGSRTE